MIVMSIARTRAEGTQGARMRQPSCGGSIASRSRRRLRQRSAKARDVALRLWMRRVSPFAKSRMLSLPTPCSAVKASSLIRLSGPRACSIARVALVRFARGSKAMCAAWRAVVRYAQKDAGGVSLRRRCDHRAQKGVAGGRLSAPRAMGKSAIPKGAAPVAHQSHARPCSAWLA